MLGNGMPFYMTAQHAPGSGGAVQGLSFLWSASSGSSSRRMVAASLQGQANQNNREA